MDVEKRIEWLRTQRDRRQRVLPPWLVVLSGIVIGMALFGTGVVIGWWGG